jgi:hypothetical protein
MESQQCAVTFQQYVFIAVVIGIAFLVVILLLIACKKCIRSRGHKWSQDNLAVYSEKWKRIEYLSTNEGTRPLAVIYACSLLDDTLKTKGYPGESLFDRLNSARIALGNNQIGKVVQLRNKLAHDVDMKPLDKEKTKHNLKIIRQALFDLNASV